MSTPEGMIATAVQAAKKAGAILTESFGTQLMVDAMYADDIKLEADRLCEAAIMETIRTAYPTHAILAEESGKAEGAEYIWYIDPLDGTVNYYYGIPYYCTTISCYRHGGGEGMGQPVAGVTYAPATDELFVGYNGAATRNGKPIQVRQEPSLDDALIITAYGNSPIKLAFTQELILDLSRRVRKTRNLGACAYDLANVAAGRATGFVEYGVRTWDIAAGRVLVESAGGKFYARSIGQGQWAVAASAPSIHEYLQSILDEFIDKHPPA